MNYRIEIMVNGKMVESVLVQGVSKPEQAIHKALDINRYVSVPSFNIYVMNTEGSYWVYTLVSNGSEIRVPYRKTYTPIIAKDELMMIMNGNMPIPK